MYVDALQTLYLFCFSFSSLAPLVNDELYGFKHFITKINVVSGEEIG